MTLLPAETAPGNPGPWSRSATESHHVIESRHDGEGGPYARRRARARARGSDAILTTHRHVGDGIGSGPAAGERGRAGGAESFLRSAHLLLLELGAGTTAVVSLGAAGFGLAHSGGPGDVAVGLAGFVVCAAIAAGTHTTRTRRCTCPAHN